MVNLEPIALFSNYKLTTSSGKHLEDISHAHIFSLLYKLVTSAKDTQDLSIGFDCYRGRSHPELTNDKTTKGKHDVRIDIKVFFGFPEYQEKCTYGLDYKLILP